MIELRGADKLQAGLKKNAEMKLVEQIVKTNGQSMQRKMVENTRYFTGHYDSSGKFHKPTGATKRSITGSSSLLSYTAGPKTEYAPYVNFGTRFMSPRPFVTDAFNAQKELFKQDMNRLTR